MQIVKTETDRTGTENTWYQQFYKNTKVEGGEYIVHSKNGNVYLANGKICSGLNLNISPTLSPQNAIDYAKTFVNAIKYMWEDSLEESNLKELKKDNSVTYYPNPELLITMNGFDLPYEPNNFKLAYKIDIFTKKPYDGKSVYIDATTGAVLKTTQIILNCNPGNSNTMFMGNQTINTTYVLGPANVLNYTLNNTCKGGGIITRYNYNAPNGNIYNATNDWSNTTLERAAGMTHWGTEKFYDFLLSTFGRKSFDDNDYQMSAVVVDNGGVDNAGWAGSPLLWTRYLISGANGQPNTYWATNDIIGHEWAHGVTEFASGLQYSGESGAINESYSDIFGALFEFYAQGGTGDWTMAEDVYISGTSYPNYIRSMSNPNICGNPDSYNGNFYTSGCNPIFTSGPMPPGCGDSHNRSGVMNYWFYLLSQGGSGTNNAPTTYTYSVTSIGMVQAGQIIYRAYNYLTSTSNFADTRNATIQSARDLYGECSIQVAQVIEAWNAVGVYGAIPCMSACVTSTNANCSANIGTANVSVTGGVTPYTYQWYNAAGNTLIAGAINSSINNLAPGTYYVIVQDNASCTVQSLNVIILGGTPTLSFTSTNSNCTGPNADGSVTVIPIGGLPPYTYQWDANANNQTTSTADNLPIGTYNVTVTDANACAVNGSTTVNAVFTPFDITYGTQITTNTTWNAPLIRVDGYVEVTNGATLTISNGTTVEFIYHPDPLDPIPYGVARLIVHPGAYLEFKGGATLTGCSGGIWDGIELWGTGIFNTGQAQANIYGKIENADIGIFTNRRPKINQSIVNNYGGLFYVAGAQFINCRKGIVITKNLINFNYNIILSTLTYNINSKYTNSYYPIYNDVMTYITAGENVNLTLTSNTFIGGINYFTGDLRGTGLLCNDCKPIITDTYGPNRFAGLTRAIEANYIYTSNQLQVTGNTITDCQEGIYMQGSSLAQIQNNIFNVPAPVLPNNKTYGILSAFSDGFDISGNTVNPVMPNANSYGFVIHKSGTTGGVIFNNTFNEVGIGIQAQNDNQNLKLGCNNFNNPVNYSLAVVNMPFSPTSLMRQQGLGCGSDGNPAGNEWIYSCNTSTSTANVFADNNVSFKYYSYNLNATSQPYTRPECSSFIWEAADMQPWICGINKTPSSCASIFRLPPPPPLTPFPDYYIAIENLITDYKNQLNVLKPQLEAALLGQDGGNTQNLLNKINQNPPMSNGQLKNLLMSSNALSDKVLIAAINRNPVLPSGILNNILLPQAPLSVAVLTALENLALPNGIKSTIYQAQTNTPQYTKASTIEAEIQILNGEIVLLESEYQRTKLNQTDNTCRACKFSNTTNIDVLAAQDFASKNEPDSVRMMLAVIQVDTTMGVTEKQNFVSYMNVIADLLDSNQTIYSATTSQIATIQTVATTNTKAGAQANAGLKARKLSHHNYKIEDIPVSNLRLMNNEEQQESHEKTQLANTDAFILYPNPNSGIFNIKIEHLEDDTVPITIIITNLLGEELLQKTVNVLTDSPIEIKDKTFAKGLYLVSLWQNSKAIGYSKLIIE
jgi:parallel beta-helix repeat protein